jgi:hypothetical protein
MTAMIVTMFGMVMMRRRRRTPLAIHPTGVTVLVVLLLPDGHSMFDFVDDVPTRLKRFSAMAGAHAYPDCHFAYRQIPNAMYAGSVFDAEALDSFGDDTLAFFDGERLKRFVLEVTDRKAFVVVANPTFERCVSTRGGIEQPFTQLAFVDPFACEAECCHGAAGLSRQQLAE